MAGNACTVNVKIALVELSSKPVENDVDSSQIIVSVVSDSTVYRPYHGGDHTLAMVIKNGTSVSITILVIALRVEIVHYLYEDTPNESCICVLAVVVELTTSVETCSMPIVSGEKPNVVAEI